MRFLLFARVRAYKLGVPARCAPPRHGRDAARVGLHAARAGSWPSSTPTSSATSTRSWTTCAGRPRPQADQDHQPARAHLRRGPPAHQGDRPLPRRDLGALADLGRARTIESRLARRRHDPQVHDRHPLQVRALDLLLGAHHRRHPPPARTRPCSPAPRPPRAACRPPITPAPAASTAPS